jgi:hypothetical protein
MRTLRAAALLAVIALALSFMEVVASGATGEDDRAAAEATLNELARSPKKDVAAEMIARAHAAQARAAALRASGDEPHARLADGLARTWAEAARDVIRAVEIEQKAATARLSATDAGAVADRERALLEEGIAQTGRLRAQLESAERSAKEEPARTSAAAKESSDAGAKKPGDAKKPAGAKNPVDVKKPADAKRPPGAQTPAGAKKDGGA